MKPKYKRLKYSLIIILFLCVGLWLILKNLNENIVFFYSPKELKAKNITNEIIRVGGLVTNGSISKIDDMLQFTITDNESELVVRFNSTPPNLFREGQGIVAKGRLVDNIFIANEILAKHDENYMPKEVANALKKSGTWRK